MGTSLRIAIGLIAAHCTLCAWAQATDTRSKVAQRARMDARNLRLAPDPAQKEPDKGTTQFALGIAHDTAEGGKRTWSTPFAASHEAASKKWKVEVTGDGWTRSTEPGKPTALGLADLTFNLYLPLSPAWIAVVGACVPTAGDAGTDSAAQHARLIYESQARAKVTWVAWADLKRFNGDTGSKSRVAQMLYGEADYHLDGERILLANVTWWRRRGDIPDTTVDVGIEYDFPFSKTLSGAVMLTRGLTDKAKHTTGEFDFIYKF
ncbi:MAG TPA: hypothetical protein VGP22_13405 [Albitalea sp.]|jgi:hypothetical protein|nr:hypothetical protein [Albitalea sp.]